MVRIASVAKLAATIAALIAPIGIAPGQVFPAPMVGDDHVDVISTEDDAHRRLTVDVAVNGRGPIRFMVDTAAERTVLSNEVARRLGLTNDGPIMLHSMSGAEVVDSVFVRGLRFSAQHVGGIRAPVLSEGDMAAAGILGLDSLRGQHLLLDFARQAMTISPSGTTQLRFNRNRQTLSARDIAGRLVITDASVAGMPVYVIIDTGSPVTIGNMRMRSLVRTRNMRNQRMGVARILSVTGGAIDTEFGLIDEVKLGGVTITDMKSAFSDLYIFRHLGLNDRPTLLLGMDSLRIFDQVSIDFATRKVRFLLKGHSRVDPPIMMAALYTANGD